MATAEVSEPPRPSVVMGCGVDALEPATTATSPSCRRGSAVASMVRMRAFVSVVGEDLDLVAEE